MKKLIILLILFVITGCASVPVKDSNVNDDEVKEEFGLGTKILYWFLILP